MIIDSHQHFWKYDPVRDDWITDDMKIIQRDFLPDDLDPIFQKLDVDGCVAVQADQSEIETNFLLGLATTNDIIKGVVGWVDLLDDQVDAKLEHYASHQLFKGVRHILQGEKKDFARSPVFQKGVSKLAAHHLTYDILVYPTQLASVTQMAQDLTNNRFVLDHLAKPYIKANKIDQWKKDIQLIAECPNVHCKLSGFVTEASWSEWKYDDFIPYFDVTLEAFGSERILFGSDWPVCLLASSYDDVLQSIQRYIQQLSECEQEAILSTNAVDFYNLKM